MKYQNGNAWLNDVRDALQASELVEPPDWVRERARRLFESRRALQAPTLFTRIRASLIFDSRRPGLAPVSRGRCGQMVRVRCRLSASR